MPVIDPSQALFEARSFLLVEDFEAMRAILRDLLRRCGARRIEVAANGREATSILRRGKCDVIVCDYNLGEGKNGQQLLEEARQAGLVSASTIWIMVTAEKTADMVMGVVEHCPDDYLLKPVTEATLSGRLQKLIARKDKLARIAAAIRAQEFQRALELCRARLAEDPGNPLEVLRIQSDLHQRLGQGAQARALYENVLARRDVPWARAGLARLLCQEGELERAREQLVQLVEDNRNYLEGYDLLAQCHQRMDDWAAAEQVLQQAVAVSPNSPQRQSALGDAALRCKNLEVAEHAYSRSLKLTEQSTIKVAAPYVGLARVYTAQGKTDQALGMLGRMAGELEGDAPALQAKAEEVRVHLAGGDAEKAEAAARAVSESIRGGTQDLSVEATMDLAETFMLMGRSDTARELLQFVVRNNHEDDDIAARALAVFEKGGMGEEGRALIYSSRSEALETMNQGARLAAQGKLDEALEAMRQARALMPRNPRLLLNHAYVVISLLQKNGWCHDLESEARRSIETARGIVPGEKRCGELLAKLEAIG